MSTPDVTSSTSEAPTPERILQVLKPLMVHQSATGHLLIMVTLFVVIGTVACLSEDVRAYDVWMVNFALTIVSMLVMFGVRPWIRGFGDIPWTNLFFTGLYMGAQVLVMGPRSGGFAVVIFTFFNLVASLLHAVNAEERSMRYAVEDFMKVFPPGSPHREMALQLVRNLPRWPEGPLPDSMRGKLERALGVPITSAQPVENVLAAVPQVSSVAPPAVSAPPAGERKVTPPAAPPKPAAARPYLAPMPIEPFEAPGDGTPPPERKDS